MQTHAIALKIQIDICYCLVVLCLELVVFVFIFGACKITMTRQPDYEPQPNESLKKFRFNSSGEEEKIEIKIPELLLPGYSFYTWPAAKILAWFLWIHRENFIGKRILEIGCGTALPGILAAKFGADVILSDSSTLPNSLKHAKRCCEVNELVPGKDIEVIGLTWGIFLKSAFDIGELDYVIASDCFYDPSVFEDVLVTVAFLLDATSNLSSPTRFLFTYQERSSDWSIDPLLRKFNLQCSTVSLESIEQLCPIDTHELMNGHSIHLFEITKQN